MNIFLFIHVLGVVFLLGNAFTVTFWKLRSDYGNALSQKLQTAKNIMLLDYIFTLPAIVMILVSGHVLAHQAGYSVFAWSWLGISYGLFMLSGIIWLFALLPLQVRLIREARISCAQQALTPAYKRASRSWNVYGVLATAAPIAAMILMVWKPAL